MLAYVFWHWKRSHITVAKYEIRQRAFHAALAEAPPSGFDGSFSVAISHPPWEAGGDEVYEDWYLLKDFGSLGRLNEAAFSNDRAVLHDAAAAVAAGGAGGLYALRHGIALRHPRYAHWISKPNGMQSAELIARLSPTVKLAQGALWMRQMALGSAQQFCLHAAMHVSVPDEFSPLVVPLRPTWPL